MNGSQAVGSFWLVRRCLDWQGGLSRRLERVRRRSPGADYRIGPRSSRSIFMRWPMRSTPTSWTRRMGRISAPRMAVRYFLFVLDSQVCLMATGQWAAALWMAGSARDLGLDKFASNAYKECFATRRPARGLRSGCMLINQPHRIFPSKPPSARVSSASVQPIATLRVSIFQVDAAPHHANLA